MVRSLLSFWGYRPAMVGHRRPPFVFRYRYAPRVHTALMIGATGLVGSQLLGQLLDDGRFGKVIAFGRKKTGQSHPKLEDHVVDFDAPESGRRS